MSLVLHGYRYSVYNRIARLALAEKGIPYDRVEVNPFAPDVPASYLALHPFGRVPTLVHDGFALYETGAITRYIDRAFPGPALQPAGPQALARMDQVIGIVDSYGYWPMVRQVFALRVFRARARQPVDEAEIARGLAASTKVLAALDPLMGPLVGDDGLTLADLHLGAMMAYFTLAPEGAAALAPHPRLAAWWRRLSTRPSFAVTDPGLPQPS
ncbi:MAG: glutathione S-transferase family protein [Reyranella sp.]|uniref:glutathione S-transferase family protein n=1 Tax=Reyranella sp. TaxID=1929291 RepID=UPI001AC98B31|nr:glutathione S-transferase family protein [Reyranella sp.]MBN9087341.1 glutathione S-transferase family protein [Reyranella sp.]